MSTMVNAEIIGDRATFDAYCTRHRVNPESAIAELVNMALGLPTDILDYLREQTAA